MKSFQQPSEEGRQASLADCSYRFDNLNNCIFEQSVFKWNLMGQWQMHMKRGGVCDMCTPCSLLIYFPAAVTVSQEQRIPVDPQ